ncbi:hypothetical protein ACX0G9_00725 [Flavitalea flava]
MAVSDIRYSVLRLSILLLPLLSYNRIARAQKNIPEKRFAGLHFDFHAGMQDSGIGKTFTPAMIDSFLAICKPDFIQVDCKGHPGISSYPTNVGTHPPAMEKDILQIWREITNKHQVSLYVHYSGILDQRAVQLHPDWARVNADGSADKEAISLFSPYTDQLMIPQLKELAGKYKLDGAWIDGDCWALRPDYSGEAKAAFTRATEKKEIPIKREDPGFFEWMEFNRLAFQQYVAHYATAVHQLSPNFRITSNWSFSSMMPEKVNIPVDYLSGDVAGSNSLYSSAFESRCLALQDKPWDLMSWSFAWKGDMKITKSPVQLKQEAAEVLAMGGGFQTYWQQNRDGSPETYQFRKMADILRFCRDRKEYCFQGNIVPQIGLLYSTYSWRRLHNADLYSSHGQGPLKGILNMLLDARFPVEIIMDHQVEDRLQNYPLIIIPEWTDIDPVIKEKLLAYVRKGGHLLLIGAEATRDFKEVLPVDAGMPVQKDTAFFAGFNGEISLLKTNFQPVRLVGISEKLFGLQMKSDDLRFPGQFPLATISTLGKGKIGGIYMDMGDLYNNRQNTFSKQLVQTIIHSLVPHFLAETTGSDYVHQVISRKKGKLYIHLINTGGAHNNPTVLDYEDCPPLHNLTVDLRLSHAPKAIWLQPGKKSIPYVSGKDGRITVKLPELQIYSILEVEENP